MCLGHFVMFYHHLLIFLLYPFGCYESFTLDFNNMHIIPADHCCQALLPQDVLENTIKFKHWWHAFIDFTIEIYWENCWTITFHVMNIMRPF